jgi:type III secretion protein V
MNSISELMAKLAKRQDIVLAVMLVLAVFMMILPLPTGVVDVLIAFNLTLSLILLMVAVYLREPLEFSAFPSVLLITTLYRLSLTISTSRLILLQHDAGDIVYTFGNFVVAGNLAVGIIIFTIITIVQFIVITKGSERVAEVGARFSLDGMPGKQMSIDGDMRAGTIDAEEAKRLRGLVQKESQLYGAMDGAMKFIKGDAIASIIVILVNIFGGMAIGILQNGMSASEALNTYSILSVGDGLVSQIPALLISITAGIIVTRVPGDQQRNNLANDLAQQLGRQSKPLFIASGVMMVFAMLPGFPTFVFLGFACLLGFTAWRVHQQQQAAGSSGGVNAGEGAKSMSPGVEPLLLLVAKNRISSELSKALDGLRWDLFERYGLAVADVRLQKHDEADERIIIQLYNETVADFMPPEGKPWVLNVTSGLQPTEFDAVAVTLMSGLQTWWISEEQANTAREAGWTVMNENAAIVYCLERVVARFAKEFIGVQETRYLMDAMEGRYGELVRELQRQAQLGRITDVLQRLVEEGVSIRDLRTIFEALIQWAPKEKEIVTLTEYIRIALRRQIVNRQKNPESVVDCWLIGGGIENMVRESIRQTSSGAYSALDQQQSDAIVQQIMRAVQGQVAGTIVTSIDVRRYIRKMLEPHLYDFTLISFQELGDDTQVNVRGNIELVGE